jgi:hypothetical protein
MNLKDFLKFTKEKIITVLSFRPMDCVLFLDRYAYKKKNCWCASMLDIDGAKRITICRFKTKEEAFKWLDGSEEMLELYMGIKKEKED